MKLEELARQAADFSRPYRVVDGEKFNLRDFSPDDTGHLDNEDKPRAKTLLARGIEALAELQERLYAQDRWGVLLIFQAMDAAGKDTVIKHVMSGVNPQGCQVVSFKSPTSIELDHDFMWRCVTHLPERGRIGIFNRSYYEETLVVRVHPEILAAQKIPPQLVGKEIWKERFEDICAFERYLTRNGFAVCKFFLNVSKEEQKRRFLERLDNPEKHWKFSARDVEERKHWSKYQAAYEETIRETAATHAPWYVVPADNKWFTRLVVAAAIIETMFALDLQYPVAPESEAAERVAARQALLAE